jgi:hypothetical protein
VATQGRQERERRLERQGPRLIQQGEPGQAWTEAARSKSKERDRRKAAEELLRQNVWNARTNEGRKGPTYAQGVVVEGVELLTCTRCKEPKPATSEFFPPHNKKRNGLDSWCRACRATYRNEIARGKFRNVISDALLKEIKRDIKECVICGAGGPLVVDHCHASGKVRGMLCSHCNRGLGHFRDDPELLEFAAEYLRQSAS